jgi:Cellulase (glycosyl hydrolase family 5)
MKVRQFIPLMALVSTVAVSFISTIATLAASDSKSTMPFIRVADDRRTFVLESTGKRFTPWGFNYDHDEKGELIEDYWEKDWDRLAEDFREMKGLDANVVRIHLQFGKFMEAADRPNEKALAQLDKLVKLAEKERLYLDLTGLGCYHKKDVPAWYDALSEADRWAAQANFWKAVAGRCKDSPAIFCYDLMNEPVVPGGKRKEGDWLGPPFAGSHFVQVITLDQSKRPRPDIARQWIKLLVRAIREHDREHLITVGLVDWSLDRPGLTSGFVPEKIATDLDFLCVHIYPKEKKVDEALDTLKGFAAAGKPVLIEETFPLQCSMKEFTRFIDESEKTAAGWIGFYWGKTPTQLRRGNTIADGLMLQWLEYFEKRARSK